NVLGLRQPTIQHIELALYLHREAIDGVFDLGGCISIEVPESATEVGRCAHLPEEPRQTFGTRRMLGRQELAKLLREIDEDGARLEHADRLRTAAIEQRRNLGVRV